MATGLMEVTNRTAGVATPEVEQDDVWSEILDLTGPDVPAADADRWREVADRVVEENPRQRLEGLKYDGPGE